MTKTVKVTDDLLKSAIQDAKVVQQVVLEKAKAELAEAFAPQIKKMLSESLDELSNESLNETEENELKDEPKKDELTDEAKKENEEELPVTDEPAKKIEDETSEKLVGDKDEITNEPIASISDAKDEFEVTGDDIEIEVVADDTMEATNIDPTINIEDEAKKDDTIVTTDEPISNEVPADVEEAKKKEEELPAEDDIMIINGVKYKKVVDEPKTEAVAVTESKIKNISTDKEVKPGKEVKDFDKDNKEVKPGKEVSTFDKEMKTIKEENENLTKQLLEHRRVVKYLKEKLNEFSTLTQKLTKINELFKKYNLNDNQMKKVVASFDLAEDVKQTNIVFNTLNESFSNKVQKVAEATPESVKKTKKLNESFASGGIGSTKTDKIAQIEDGNEIISSAQGARFAKLAGIKK